MLYTSVLCSRRGIPENVFYEHLSFARSLNENRGGSNGVYLVGVALLMAIGLVGISNEIPILGIIYGLQ